MFSNYLKLTFRNIFKNKTFFIINVLGLGLSLAICIVAYLNTRFQDDYDILHTQRDNIYKVDIFRELPDREQEYGISPVTLAHTIAGEIPGQVEVVRYTQTYPTVKVDDNIFHKTIGFADTNFFRVFDLTFISGNALNFNQKGKIIISNELSGIYFGNEDPVGKNLTLFNDKGVAHSFLVEGVFEKLPLNSTLSFDALTSFESFCTMWEVDEFDWKNWVAATFFHIPDKKMVPTVTNILNDKIAVQNKAREDWKIKRFSLVPLKDVPEKSQKIYAHWLRYGLHPAAINTPPVMALLILLIACFNFTNTSIAISGKRLKEIGLRKVLGGYRRQITFQFLLENLLICFFALILALFFARILVPEYNRMWDYLELTLTFRGNIPFWIFLISLLVVTGVAAGAYPAFYVSSFNPVKILQGRFKIGGGGAFSKVLLTMQFIIAIMSLVSGTVYIQNANYQNNMHMGYDKDMIIAMPFQDPAKYLPLKNSISGIPDIIQVSGSEEHIGWSDYLPAISVGDKKSEVSALDVGVDYLETMGLKIRDGRYFDLQHENTDAQGSIVVNEQFVKEFGWDNALGKKVLMNDTIPLTIVGVVNDFYLYGFWSPVRPTLFRLAKTERMRMLSVRAPKEKLAEVNRKIEKAWEEIFPNSPYEGFFQEDRLKEAKNVNKNIKNVNLFLALIAVIISMIGLYTLVSLNIINRIKELGVRKVLGASILHITRVINIKFLYILLIASVLGCIFGYYLNEMLMSSIWENHVEVNWITFAIPVTLIFLMALLTLSGRVYRAASRNPVESLRYE